MCLHTKKHEHKAQSTKHKYKKQTNGVLCFVQCTALGQSPALLEPLTVMNEWGWEDGVVMVMAVANRSQP